MHRYNLINPTVTTEFEQKVLDYFQSQRYFAFDLELDPVAFSVTNCTFDVEYELFITFQDPSDPQTFVTFCIDKELFDNYFEKPLASILMVKWQYIQEREYAERVFPYSPFVQELEMELVGQADVIEFFNNAHAMLGKKIEPVYNRTSVEGILAIVTWFALEELNVTEADLENIS